MTREDFPLPHLTPRKPPLNVVRQVRLPVAGHHALEQIERQQLPLFYADLMPLPDATNEARNE